MSTEVGKIHYSLDLDDSKFKSKMSSVSASAKSLAKGIAVFGVATGVAAIGMIKSASEVENLRTNLDILTGSTEKGAKTFKDLYQFAAKTPFETGDLADATSTMLQFGIAQKDVMPNLKMLGDISLGNKDKLKSLTLAFSQVQSTGRLMGQDLLQMINAGFNPLQIISQKTGKSMATLKKEMEKGAISADMVRDAMSSATSKGGLFYKGMDKGANTLQGRFSTLMDTIKMTANSIVGISETGEVIKGGLFDKVSQGVQDLSKYLDENKEKIKQVFDSFTRFKNKIVETYLAIKTFFTQTKTGQAIVAYFKVLIDMVVVAFKWLWGEIVKNKEMFITFGKAIAIAIGVAVAFIIAAVAVIGATLAIIVKVMGWVYKQVKLAIDRTIQGFKMWGVVIKAAIGWVKGLWDKVKYYFGKIKEFAKGIFDGVKEGIKSALNGAIRLANKFITGYNKMPGPDIPEIPYLAKGVRNFSGGMAVVGEQGPELVNLPKGSDVIPNNKIATKSGGDNITLHLHMDGIMARSRSDLREIAKDMIGAVNEELRAKGKPQLGVA